jgi:hypothetical protein
MYEKEEKTMKPKKLGVILLALLLAAMAMVPGVCAEKAADLSPPQGTDIITKNPVRLDDPADSVRNSTATYSMPEKDQNEIFEAVEKSSLSDKEKADLIQKLTAIWSGTSKLSDEETEDVFVTVYSIIMDTGEPGLKWTGYPVDPNYKDVHNDMAWIAGYSMGLGSSAANTLASIAGEPDYPPPGASWNHYYSSGAADEAESYADLAQSEWSSDPPQALSDLAYSMHFMADMSQPFHYWFAQGLPQHAAYESFVGDNWHSGEDFYTTVAGDGYYYSISDVSDAASYLAWKSHYQQNQYDYINNAIQTDPNWQSDSTLIQYTGECLIDGERYQMGLVDYVA